MTGAKPEQQSIGTKALSCLPALVALLFVLLWFAMQSQQSINPDNAYLTHAAMKFLSGERMSEAYYDVNPPLSFLIYLPVAIASIYGGIPVYYGVFIYSCILVSLGFSLLRGVLAQGTLFAADEQKLISYIYLFASTIATMNFFGERDLFIALALVPLFLLQISMTRHDPISPRVKWGILIFASLFIFLKPHYGLLPACAFLHRMMVQKRITIFKDHDFLILAAASIFHASIIFLLFRDYVDVILPDIIYMYVTRSESIVNQAVFEYGAAIIMVGILCMLCFNKPYFQALAFLGASALCLLVYYIMNKGFLYQLIPFTVFFSCALALVLYRILSTQALVKQPSALSLLLVTIFMGAGFYVLLSPPIPFPTHQEYQDDAVTNIIKNCDAPCSFFMFNDRIDITHELATYSAQPLASRFPTFFFLPFLIESNNFVDEETRTRLSQKYSDMVAQDFKKFRPDTLLIGRFKLEQDNDYFDFIGFFKEANPEFDSIFDAYTLTDTIEINQSAYTGGLFLTTKSVLFDVYKRKPQNP